MNTELRAPQQNETIRGWIRRLRDSGERVELDTLKEYNWAHIECEDFFKIKPLDWLRTNVGEENFIWVAKDFFFTKEEDAVMFKLMWSGQQ